MTELNSKQIKIVCIHCYEPFSFEDSTASTPEARTMFCSIECEQLEDARLAEGNKIIAAAIAENPLAFAHTLAPQPPDGEIQEITNRVDSVFQRLGIKTGGK